MESLGRSLLRHFTLLVLLGAVAIAQQHAYSQIMFCQPGEPTVAATEMFDQDEILSYDFSGAASRARIPAFEEWAKERSTQQFNDSMQRNRAFCAFILKNLSSLFIPQVKVDPVSAVYTRDPLEYGKPNTLICFVDSFFPPVISVSWYVNNTLITSGVSFTDSYPKDDFGFQMFAYLDFTPKFGERYSCHIKHGPSQYPFIEFWVPEEKPSTDVVMTALCAVAFAIGILGFIGGIVFLILGIIRKRQDD